MKTTSQFYKIELQKLLNIPFNDRKLHEKAGIHYLTVKLYDMGKKQKNDEYKDN